MSGLQVENLSAALGGRPVLKGVSLAAQPGETVALLGPNGAGKSTLLRCLAGLVPATTGTASWNGSALAAMEPGERARILAYLPQDRVVHWNLAARAIVALGRLPHGGYGTRLSPADETIVDDAMEAMDVAHLAYRPAAAMSGGELARVLAARLIAQDTPLLLADEPAASLDPAHQIRLMASLRRQAGLGKAVLVSLHDIELAARWSDRVIIMRSGTILADGKPDNAISPATMADAYGITARIGRDECGLTFTPLALTANGDAP